ncbi:MAG: DUF2231 domain-containing protein [Mycobacteriales bacterium]
MRTFSFRPALTMSGRANKGLRGLAGKPFHPPLTDVPVGAYLLAAAFDVLSLLTDGDLARELFRAATFALIGGAVVSLFAATTGIADWARSTSKGTQARRTANAHGATMITVTVLVLLSIVLRLGEYADDRSTPGIAVALTVLAALLTTVGGALGGSLVYDYGFNVETAGDSPVWHESEADVLPGAAKH